MKLEDALVKHIGELTVSNIKLSMMLEMAKAEIAKQAATIRDLQSIEPSLPLDDKPAEVRNGAH